jgi:hypothetical protein
MYFNATVDHWLWSLRPFQRYAVSAPLNVSLLPMFFTVPAAVTWLNVPLRLLCAFANPAQRMNAIAITICFIFSIL